MRFGPDATGSNAANCMSELQRTYRQCALADGDGDRFPGVPLLAVVAHLPRTRWQGAFRFVGKIDSGLRAEAGHLRVLGNVVNAHAVAKRVEENVAGLSDCLAEIY